MSLSMTMPFSHWLSQVPGRRPRISPTGRRQSTQGEIPQATARSGERIVSRYQDMKLQA
jgi:hypothetical protein